MAKVIPVKRLTARSPFLLSYVTPVDGRTHRVLVRLVHKGLELQSLPEKPGQDHKHAPQLWVQWKQPQVVEVTRG